MKKIPDEINNDKNAQILNFLSGKSCYGDIVEPLAKVFSRLKDIEFFCPDGRNFAWCCWCTNGVIFAYVVGMREVGLRLALCIRNKIKGPVVLVVDGMTMSGGF